MLLPWISVWTQRKKISRLFSKIMQRNFFFFYKTMQRNAVLLVCFLFINVVSCYLQWWCTVCGGLVLGESEIFLAPPFPTPVILQNWHPVAPSNQLISYPDLLLALLHSTFKLLVPPLVMCHCITPHCATTESISRVLQSNEMSVRNFVNVKYDSWT